MIVIYYLDENGKPAGNNFEDKNFGLAMVHIRTLREQGFKHVVMSNEPSDMVGQVGVSAVEDGKTPQGEVYDWSKAGRAGRVRNPDRPIYNDGELVRPKDQ